MNLRAAMNGSSLPRGLQIGSLLTLIAGLFVFSVAAHDYVNFYVGLTHPSEPWRSSGFAPSNYSLDDIRAFDPSVADDFVKAQHIEFANVINTGALVTVITVFGLRRFQKWAWYTLLAIFLWVGLNDAVALLQEHQVPLPLIPEVIGLSGLFIARSSIFGRAT
ncbi:MAG TPA: hypothetical protein VGS57_11415 [Thermoanaerobaculia bacterium]|nr:hypothetical protein [Thermoanaerobaculia bacterium]